MIAYRPLLLGALLLTASGAFAQAKRPADIDPDSLARLPGVLAALPQAPSAASVLVKGSRFMKMEMVVQALQALQSPAAAAGGAPCC